MIQLITIYLTLISIILLSLSIGLFQKAIKKQVIVLKGKDLWIRFITCFLLWNLTWPLLLTLLLYKQ